MILALLFAPTPVLSSDLTITITESGSGQPVAGAVVFLDRVDPVTPVSAEIYQQHREFHPKVTILPVGSSVDFPNRDNTQHHVYSFSPAKPFNIELYADRPEASVLFDKPGIVELGCNIHDHMQAFVVVTDTSAIGRTDDNGRTTLALGAEPASGPLTLKIWHTRLPDNTQPVTRVWSQDGRPSLTIELTPEPALDDSLDLLQRRFQEL